MTRWPSGKAVLCKRTIREFDSRPGLRTLDICPSGEMVATRDLKFLDRKVVWVRVPPRAHV